MRAEGPTPLGAAAGGGALIALVAYSPAVDSLFWSPKAAVVPVFGALGLVSLVSLASTQHRRAAAAALAFLIICAGSTIASPNPTLALFGKYQIGTGVLFVVAIVGAWAIGVQLTAADRRLLARSVAAGTALNIVVGASLVVFDLSEFQLFPVAARSAGLLGNPVYFGSLMAGATAALVSVLSEDRRRRWPVAGFPLGIGIQISGSRFALLAVGAAVGLGFLRHRSVRLVALVGALAVGAVAGSALLASGQPVGSASSSTARLQAGAVSGGFAPRVATWISSRHAIGDHPALGSGPGTFALATSRYRTPSIAKSEGAEQLFADAHNLVVEYAVTTGAFGLLALLVWLAHVLVRARGPFADFGVGVLALHLVQPQYVGTTPVAFLCLGAAALPNGATRTWREWSLGGRVIALGALVAGMVAGGALVYGDVLLKRAELDFEVADAEQAEAILPHWPEPAVKLSKVHAFLAITQRNDKAFDEALRWQREAVRREPMAPSGLIRLGEFELSQGQTVSARRDFYAALSANPQSVRARLGVAQAELILGRRDEALRELRAASPLATPAQRSIIERLRVQADQLGS